MARKTPKNTSKTSETKRASDASEHPILLRREDWGLVLIVIGIITIIALLSPSQGKVSEAWSLALRRMFGVGAYPIALLLLTSGVLLLIYKSLRWSFHPRWQTIVGAELAFVAILGLVHAMSEEASFELALAGRFGGFVGWALARILVSALGPTIAIIILVTILLAGVELATNIPWATIIWRIRWVWIRFCIMVRTRIAQRQIAMREPAQRPTHTALEQRTPKLANVKQQASKRSCQPKPVRQRKTKQNKPSPTPIPQKSTRSLQNSSSTNRVHKVAPLPPLDLLTPDRDEVGDDADARMKAEIIEETLSAFGVPAQVVEWNRGPVVTQFGIEPGYIERQDRDGNVRRYKIRVSKILSLTNDLALALAAAPIRIEAPVPGRAIIGIEVPNNQQSVVGLRGVLESPQFRRMKADLRIALGRDVSGRALITDMAKMPHLLIAGATGSGKSICLNAIIASILYFCSADQVRLLLVDPKRVELSKFNGIPHLIAPVIVDIDKTILALRWLNREMEKRYKLLAEAGVRNLHSYNNKAQKIGVEPLPNILVFIDELADLMLTAPEDVERTICRLAQMARATGIHLVIATQRPSVDVVTGLIKANFPARVSFAVSSQIDSRVILDTPGAEKLLGRGDMLFMAPDSAKLQRVQGCFVSEKEVDNLVAFYQTNHIPEQPAEVVDPPWEDMADDENEAQDDITTKAIALVRQHKQASASFLQRQLRIGYPRAARLIDQLEEMGIVGGAETGGRSRTVLDYGHADENETSSDGDS